MSELIRREMADGLTIEGELWDSLLHRRLSWVKADGPQIEIIPEVPPECKIEGPPRFW
jgi:hypothetical protein